MGLQHMRIGQVAELTGLSLRTIRYYEELGLVIPSSRSSGGFRLYTETDVARLRLVKRMKPLDFSLDEMKDVLGVLDALEDTEPTGPPHADLLERLVMYREAADVRVIALRDKLAVAEEFAADLRREVRRRKRLASQHQ
ncbi:MAG: MerR family transcriptional regulator [Propionibacteriales bacterium]|nr:MerR family transcriptional regulator [Propionibacteriales bacterium]